MQNEKKLYDEALQFYQARNLAEAEKKLRQILSQNPHHSLSLHMMAIIALDVNRYDIAEELARSAIHEQDNNPSFYFTLGRILNRREKAEDAIGAYRKALQIKPDFTDALNNLGTILLSLNRHDEASEIFARILEKDPRNFNALSNTGSIFYKKKSYEEAIIIYQQALAINPLHATLHYDMGRALKETDKSDEAMASLQKAIEIEPENLDALLALADIYRDLDLQEEALSVYKKVKSIKPHEDAFANTVRIFLAKGLYSDAVMEAEEAVKALRPSAQNYNNLAHAYNKNLMFEKSLEHYERALELDPENPDIYANISNTLNSLGRLDDSMKALKKGLSLAKDNAAWIHGNLLLAMVYASSITPEELAEASREFGRKIADLLLRQRPFTYDRNPDRKLRIGYVSPDFRDHSVSYFLSFISKINKDDFELFAYANVEKQDEKTEKFKREFCNWRNIRHLKDDAIADLIESDKIDILVDLAGHTANNNLMVFARKPAPIQVSWLGYPATTGLKAMDYRITDPYTEPSGMTEHLNVEKLWRLPDIFCVYAPHEKSPDVTDHPPFEDNGYVTFGCFNNFAKVTDPVLKTWAKILAGVPDSKLLLEIAGVDSEKMRAGILERFVSLDIPIERVILKPHKKANQYVLYNQIDMALDPFPCNGGTTSMDTLWMGVPFVTLAGKHFVSRMGVTILTNAGLPELIAKTTDEYVKIAVDLANDRERLKKIRAGLREKFAASPVMDQVKFARNIEATYREMWKKFVSKKP